MTKQLIATASIFGILTTAGCRPTPAVITAPQPTATASAAAVLPDSIRWVRDSAEYHAVVLQVYRSVTTSVEIAARNRQAGRWAVVLDADETIISNQQYQIERAKAGLTYSPDSWRSWVARRAATPLPGAAAFLSRVRDLGGRIAIVTNRLESECPDTEVVFKKHGLPYDLMLCRADTGPSDKNPRFAAVAAGTTNAGGPPLDTVAFVGDNILDFPNLNQAARKDEATLAPFGVRYFLVPNPMYGSWQ